MSSEAEIGATRPQAKEHHQPQKLGRGVDGSAPRASEEVNPACRLLDLGLPASETTINSCCLSPQFGVLGSSSSRGKQRWGRRDPWCGLCSHGSVTPPQASHRDGAGVGGAGLLLRHSSPGVTLPRTRLPAHLDLRLGCPGGDSAFQSLFSPSSNQRFQVSQALQVSSGTAESFMLGQKAGRNRTTPATGCWPRQPWGSSWWF